MNKKAILRDYLLVSMQSDLILRLIENIEKTSAETNVLRSTSQFELKLANYNETLADIEDANPWIANVLVAMEEV
jgi:hypothetical protein